MDLSTLNDKQREAAETLEGPLLILAGAGSGKTRALTYRIANLVEHGVSPYSILALTFTNKAAAEMRARVEGLVGDTQGMWITTFHSCCHRILRMDIDKLGRERTFVIYDDADQMSVIGDAIKKLGYSDKDIPKRDVKARISDAKNKSADPEAWLRDDRYADAAVLKIFRYYQETLRKANALDFDDLLLLTLQLLENDPDTLQKYRARFRYVLVDEYQDTNDVQYRLVELLCREGRNICVVGDDDQSIYGWRGADIRNILEFEKDFSGAKVIRLEQNYRSAANILSAANAVIGNNKSRKLKKLWTQKDAGEKVRLFTADTEFDEADYVCRHILQGLNAGRKYSDHAILYRMNAQSRILENKLRGYGIPYKVYGGLRFYERREIKDILAYLRLIHNPADNVALGRIINVPRRGVGDTAVAELSAAAEAQGMPMMLCAMTGEGISERLKKKLTPFVDTMTEFMAMEKVMPLSEFTEKMIAALEYETYLRAEDKKGEMESRMDNLRELIGEIAEMEKSLPEGEDALAAYLGNVALFTDIDGLQETEDNVALMTLHSAKGLEFPVVFIVGMEENIFPSARACMEIAGTAIEEERRLCYVGITRAQEQLYLLNTRGRKLFNRQSWNRPSRFLEEIPETLVENDTPHRERTAWTAEKTEAPAYRTGFGNVPLREPPKPPDAKPKEFALHQRVQHEKFGEGTVMEIERSGMAMTVTIDFDTVGVKRFAAAYAPIKPVE